MPHAVFIAGSNCFSGIIIHVRSISKGTFFVKTHTQQLQLAAFYFLKYYYYIMKQRMHSMQVSNQKGEFIDCCFNIQLNWLEDDVRDEYPFKTHRFYS